jgi:hypothetical protein
MGLRTRWFAGGAAIEHEDILLKHQDHEASGAYERKVSIIK